MTHPMIDAVRGRFRASSREWRPEIEPWVAGLLVSPLVFALTAFFILPLIQLVVMSFTQPEIGIKNYVTFFTHPLFVRSIIKTYWISLLVTIISLLIGAMIAWELRMTTNRILQIILWGGILLPLWMSTIVRNYAFTILLQRNGIINDALLFLGLVDRPLRLLYTDFAVFLGIMYYMLPYAVLPLYATFVQIDKELLDAAQSLGASYIRSFASVVIPLATPSFLAAGAIVFVISLGFYITPLLLGGPQAQFIATAISIQIFNLFDLPGAAASGVILLVTALICVGLIWRFVGWERIQRALA